MCLPGAPLPGAGRPWPDSPANADGAFSTTHRVIGIVKYPSFLYQHLSKPAYLTRQPLLQDDELSPEAILVRNALIEHRLETPMIETGLSARQKYGRIRELMTDVVKTLGPDLSDDCLAETPHRIAKMHEHEIFSGLDYRRFPKLSLIENKMGAGEMVKIRDIDLTRTTALGG